MFAVAVGTIALIIVLSVFNGLEGLIRSLYNAFDPDLQVTLVEGKFFTKEEALIKEVLAVEGVAQVVEAVEDNVLIRYDGGDAVVRMKGISSTEIYQQKLVNNISEGTFKLKEKDRNFTVIGRGIRYQLGINPRNDFLAVQFYYPKTLKPGVTDPSRLYNSALAKPAGVFALEKQYDEKYVFVSLAFAQQLINRKEELTALEITLKEGASIQEVQHEISDIVGDKFKVLNSDQQHESLLKAIKIEKLFLYITFSFILAVASFTIFFCLTMLVLDKKKDINIMKAMGFPDASIRNIFLYEGAIISFIGAAVGTVIGFTICYLQQQYGLVSMGVSSAVQEAYPVKMLASDFLFIVITIVLITFFASIHPARKAQKMVDVSRL